MNRVPGQVFPTLFQTANEDIFQPGSLATKSMVAEQQRASEPGTKVFRALALYSCTFVFNCRVERSLRHCTAQDGFHANAPTHSPHLSSPHFAEREQGKSSFIVSEHCPARVKLVQYLFPFSSLCVQIAVARNEKIRVI